MNSKEHGCVGGALGQMKRLGPIVAVLGMSYLTACGPSELSVTTQRYDNARTGQNLSETILNTSNVNPVEFGNSSPVRLTTNLCPAAVCFQSQYS